MLFHASIIIPFCIFLIVLAPYALQRLFRAHGRALTTASLRKRRLLTRSCSDADKQVIIGFFHPYCNAGGGGERVLWSAIRTIQLEHKNLFCIVYTGDVEATKDEMLRKAADGFGIDIDPDRIAFIFLGRRSLVSAERWPRFTLLGQSLGSMLLAYEAMSNLVPDIYIDTMGYAFTYPLVKHLLNIPVATYTHYPTIQDDMFLQNPRPHVLKRAYWNVFRFLYCLAGRYADIVVANSTWTIQHLRSLWKLEDSRCFRIFPPCDTASLNANALKSVSEEQRHDIVCIAQYRPEKRHELLLRAFAKFLEEARQPRTELPRLICIGSVRNVEDTERVAGLKKLAKSLNIADKIDLRVNVPWADVRHALCTASIGTNAMWNEHFGIGVVEYMAAGLICVVHASGGPLLDIVIPFQGSSTGFHASDAQSFAAAFRTAYNMSLLERSEMRRRAIKSSARFSEDVFHQDWKKLMQVMLRLYQRHTRH